MLQGKCVVIGVTGGIAAHRALDLTSNLVKAGATVHVIMTAGAQQFIRPLAFEAISRHTVHVDTFATPPGWRFPHLQLARQADIAVIVPATAGILAKLAWGMADDLLTTAVLAMTCPVLVAPAMNVYMYQNQAVQDNLARLRQLGFDIVEPASGSQACGDVGPGRLVSVDMLMQSMRDVFNPPSQDLAGLTVMVTAGGTKEPIDPVRYIGNRSSGKMGYAVARAARDRGAKVHLITTPTSLTPPADVNLIQVHTAAQMHQAVLELYPQVDVVVKAAAVADYRPRQQQDHKMKKLQGQLLLELEKTEDILWELGQNKTHQLLVGFAAETQHLMANARSKLAQKNLDFLVANDVTQCGAGFGTDTNIVKIIFADGRVSELPMMDKLAIGHVIWDEVIRIKQK